MDDLRFLGIPIPDFVYVSRGCKRVEYEWIADLDSRRSSVSVRLTTVIACTAAERPADCHISPGPGEADHGWSRTGCMRYLSARSLRDVSGYYPCAHELCVDPKNRLAHWYPTQVRCADWITLVLWPTFPINSPSQVGKPFASPNTADSGYVKVPSKRLRSSLSIPSPQLKRSRAGNLDMDQGSFALPPSSEDVSSTTIPLAQRITESMLKLQEDMVHFVNQECGFLRPETRGTDQPAWLRAG